MNPASLPQLVAEPAALAGPEATAEGAAAWRAELASIDLRFGDGAVEQLGEVVAQLGGRRVLLVTDPGVRAAGHAARAAAALAAVDVEIFDAVEENPTTEHVAAGVDAAREHAADLLVAVGGGSVMDCAKGINFLYTNGGEMADYWGKDKATRPMLPSVGVPTTAGTGSEGQSYALISQPETHRKMACGDRKARFRTVILDPSLTASVPRAVAANTGFDAVSHAVESYVTLARTPISQLLAREAWRLLEGAFETSLKHRGDAGARQAMLLGAHLAGAAIEQSMLGAAHATANPLTARFDVTHGSAVGLMLPPVVAFNGAAEAVDRMYGELLAAAGLAPRSGSNGQRLACRLRELRAAAGLPEHLEEAGIGGGDLPKLAAEAAEQWTGRFNPRPVAAAEFLELYRAAFSP